ARILQAEGRGATMIFTRTKRTAQKVCDELAERGFKVGAVHGDLGQIAREKALKAFREGEVDVLVATDVAARGIDIDDITHVINYQIPEDEQAYVHRIGRTGRAGKTGIAITLVDWDELERWSMINKALALECPDPAETYSNSPHLYEELGIPTEAGGSIGSARKAQGARRPAKDESRISSADRKADRKDGRTGDRPARNRSRQRTRAGEGASGHVEKPSGTTVSADGSSAPAAEGGSGRPRRRRRRGPRKAAEAGASTD
ncbi:MAG: helicase-related protein, partial [Mycobacterium sp.]